MDLERRNELEQLAKLDAGEQAVVAEILAAGDASGVKAAKRIAQEREPAPTVLTSAEAGDEPEEVGSERPAVVTFLTSPKSHHSHGQRPADYGNNMCSIMAL
jgi:hypothetical protein